MWLKSIGIFLIIVGTIMLAYTGFTYTTTKKVVDLGTIQINQKEEHPVEWPPYVGVVLLAGGFVILVAGRKKHV